MSTNKPDNNNNNNNSNNDDSENQETIAISDDAVAGFLMVIVGTTAELLQGICCRAAALAASASSEEERRTNGRYLRRGTVPSQEHSVWSRCDNLGDDMEFFHFVSLSRESFENLVSVLQPTINKLPLRIGRGQPSECHLRRRMFQPRDIVAMTLKYLLSSGGNKDLHVQFGSIASVFCECVFIGISAIVTELVAHPFSKVYWDRSPVACAEAASRTESFLAIPGVIAMMDGLKLKSKTPSNWRLQNRDYNGWTGTVNRNMILVWNPWGKIVDAAVNTPGNFHDSKSALYCHIYDHVAALPNGYKVVCDSAFQTTGDLAGKLVKVTAPPPDGLAEGIQGTQEYEAALTHLRQCSEGGINILTGSFKRLKADLPTDNTSRARLQWACIWLHNWRTHTCDRNQIRTYFDSLVEWN